MLSQALVINASFTLDKNSARASWQINCRSKKGLQLGTHAVSPAALNYSSGYLDERLRYEQTVVGYNTSGSFFDGISAGPFSMAVGVQRRQEVGHNDEVSCPANDAACQARIQGFATVAWRHDVRT
jgi:hypothetical protein